MTTHRRGYRVQSVVPHRWTGGLTQTSFGAGHERKLRVIFDQIARDAQPYVFGMEAKAAADIILSIYRDANG